MTTIVGFATPPGGSPAATLGEFIFALNPYMAVYPPESAWTDPYPPPIVTLPTGSAAKGVLYFLDSTGIEHQERPDDWKFKYTEHFVQRALRIPYMYYKEHPHTSGMGVLVRDYLLIGYEGGAAY